MSEADSDRSPKTKTTVTKRTLAVTAVACGLGLAGVSAALAVALADAGGAGGAPAASGSASASTLSSAVTASQGCKATTSKITVQGTGRATGTPDVLNANFGFSTTAGSSTAALSENNDKVTQAVTALESNGLAAGDVQTTGLSLLPQYAFPDGVPTLTGYQVTDTISATMREVTKAGAAIDAVVGAAGDAAQINGLNFSFADPAKVQDEARAQAVHLAVAHAEAMAAAAGRRLGPVCSLTDNTQPEQQPPFASPGFVAQAAPSSAVPVQPGSQLETDQVTIVYALVPGRQKR
jgi:uncharacterized protein YggE